MEKFLHSIKQHARLNGVASGMSVIEVLIAIGMAAIVIAAVGNLIGATHRLTTNSGKEIQATAFARQWLDIVTSQANSVVTNQGFGCSCGATTCTSCTAADGQSCPARSSAGFRSCWVGKPLGLSSANTFKLTQSGATFSFQSADGARDVPAAGFERWLTVTNLQRDGNGAIIPGSSETSCDAAHDCNTKLLTVTISWKDGATTRQKELSTVLTAWKNF